MTTNATRRGLAGHPVLALGFRPFYLLAALFAVIALPFWLSIYLGFWLPDGYLRGATWHSHEMVFGFAAAVIAGFLLTAVRNWTGQPTPTGTALAALAMLWILGRILILTGPMPMAVIVDLSFIPALGLAIGIPIWRSKNARNYKIMAVLAALVFANAVYHLAYMNWLPVGLTQTSLVVALDVITILMAIVGGRVIPAFTANANSAANPRRVRSVEVVALGSLMLILAARILAVWYPLAAQAWFLLFAIAGMAHLIRWVLWKPHQTYRNALLWMLPVAYFWIPVSLTLRAIASITSVTSAAAVHALTVGAISGLMLAMMTRSSLGHTGRPLSAGITEVSAFLLVQLAAVVRLSAGVMRPEHYQSAIVISGIIWSLAFAVFLVRYLPMLIHPRIDGRPG